MKLGQQFFFFWGAGAETYEYVGHLDTPAYQLEAEARRGRRRVRTLQAGTVVDGGVLVPPFRDVWGVEWEAGPVGQPGLREPRIFAHTGHLVTGVAGLASVPESPDRSPIEFAPAVRLRTPILRLDALVAMVPQQVLLVSVGHLPVRVRLAGGSRLAPTLLEADVRTRCQSTPGGLRAGAYLTTDDEDVVTLLLQAELDEDLTLATS